MDKYNEVAEQIALIDTFDLKIATTKIAAILRASFPAEVSGERDEALAAIEKAREEVRAICNGKRWTMCIPAREGEDSDLVISDALHKAEQALLASRPAPSAEARNHLIQAVDSSAELKSVVMEEVYAKLTEGYSVRFGLPGEIICEAPKEAGPLWHCDNCHTDFDSDFEGKCPGCGSRGYHSIKVSGKAEHDAAMSAFTENELLDERHS